jgi:hypothetical protein
VTIAATATTEFTVEEIVTLALQSAGLLNPAHPASAGDLAFGRKLLFLVAQDLANKGIFIRTIERYTLTLTAGTAYVDAPADTVTIEKGGSIRDDSNGDLAITMIARAQYMAMPRKDTEGVPSFYYAEQQPAGTWRIFFYPVPIAGWTTFIVPRTRKSRDMTTGAVTLDFDPRWHLTIVNALAGRLARSKGRRDLATELIGEAQVSAENAMNNETERGDLCFSISATPWDRW